ncbi:nitroreductase family protein, partial [Actinotalea sp.]|uniref:nitroreductase family protein n=1 Tax=Actinotalea sp. TaxID=1872145 RepID=UPI00356A12C3
RWFLDKPVDRELIDRALAIGRQSPSACNRLPYEFLVFDDPELVKKVGSIPFGAAGYYEQIPTLIVVKGRLDDYFSPRDRHVIYIDASLASMAFMLGLETLGLSSSVINWPDFEPLEAKMAKTLGLAPHERVIMLMAVGYADPTGLVAFSQKKDLDVIRTFNPVVS